MNKGKVRLEKKNFITKGVVISVLAALLVSSIVIGFIYQNITSGIYFEQIFNDTYKGPISNEISYLIKNDVNSKIKNNKEFYLDKINKDLEAAISSRESYFKAEINGEEEKKKAEYERIKTKYGITDKDIESLNKEKKIEGKDNKTLSEIDSEINRANYNYNQACKSFNDNNVAMKRKFNEEATDWKERINNSDGIDTAAKNVKNLGFFYQFKDANGNITTGNKEGIESLYNDNSIFYYEVYIGKTLGESKIIKDFSKNHLIAFGEYGLENLFNIFNENKNSGTFSIVVNSDSFGINTALGKIIKTEVVENSYNWSIIFGALLIVVFLLALVKPYRGKSLIVRKYCNLFFEVKLGIVILVFIIIEAMLIPSYMISNIFNSYDFIYSMEYIKSKMIIVMNNSILLFLLLFIFTLIVMLFARDLRYNLDNGKEGLLNSSLIMRATNKKFRGKRKIREGKKEFKVINKFKDYLKAVEEKSLNERIKFLIIASMVYLIIFGGFIFKTYNGITIVPFWQLRELEIMITPLITIIMAIVFPVFIFIIWRKFIIQLREITVSTEKIVKGNFDLELVDRETMILNPISKNLSNINEGFKEAIETELKSERMKAELITNVSEDLKRPLTSIINQVDLLKNKNLNDKERLEILKVLENKSKNLKGLIESLFEATKASTGNIKLNIEDVNVVSILRQTLAEFEEEIEESGLLFRVRLPENKVVLKLDGARTWRVFENLISNVLKYSLKDSRVYIDLYEKEERVYCEIKNIAAYELDCTLSELREKIKESKISEEIENSGLGLSIANSLVEIQGGTMNIDIDGDLFKVKIVF